VSLSLNGRTTVGRFVLDADLQTHAGEVLAVVGPNGSGKTTTLATVAGLQRLATGRLELEGTVLDEPGTGRWVPPHARRIGYVFQHHELFPHLTALDNVAYGLRRRGLDRRAARGRAQEWLQRLEVAHLAASRPRTLSGGQAQRVALARALAVEPRVLLLDEPMNALDAEGRATVRSLLRRLVHAFGGVTLLVTHDVLDVFSLADRVAVLDTGRVAQLSTPDQLRRHPRTRHAAAMVGRNLVTGVVDDDHVDLGHGIVVALRAPHQGPVDVVCSPRAVRLAPRSVQRPPGAWESTLVGVEAVGDHARASLGPPLPLMARIRLEDLTGEFTLDAPVWVWLAPDQVEIYPAGDSGAPT
jgi:molybdate transport system ATP-binding protein